MATTPEGKVKKEISALLKAYKDFGVYYRMPVPSGFGKTTIDYEGCSKGRFFGIEAKKPGVNEPTTKQRAVMDEIEAAGGRTFFINDGSVEGLRELIDWLNA